MIVAGVDVGGTNIEVGLVDDDHRVVGRAKARTPSDGPDAVVGVIRELLGSLDEAPVALGAGIPGVVHRGDVLQVPNLPGWHGDVDLRARLETALDLPIALGNDANVGLLGEWFDGAAKDVANVLGVWLGTGVGGGLILAGRPYDGSRGAAGEIGHVVVRAQGALCRCGRRGCVEAYAGRRSMADAARSLADAGRETRLFAIRDQLGKAELTSKVWARALEDEDPLATELYDLAVDTLGIGIANVVNTLDVELVVIGGGLAEKLGQPLADRVGLAARPWMMRPHPDLAWVPAALGDDSGVVGAASLARAAVVSG